MQEDLPKRKNIRLQGYDYSQVGYYCITMCVKDKRELFGTIDVGANYVRPNLSETGNIVDNEIVKLSAVYKNIRIDKYVVMPNHMHVIIIIAPDDSGQDSGRTQFAPTVSRIIKQFKGTVTKQIGFSIWQRSFYDRIIRNEAEYQHIWQYIDENPLKWDTDYYNEKSSERLM